MTMKLNYRVSKTETEYSNLQTPPGMLLYLPSG